MKRYLVLIFIFVLGIIPCFGQENLFRFGRQVRSEEAQSFVGRKVVFYEPVNQYERRFHLKGINIGKTYSIQSIKIKDGNALSDPMVYLCVTDDYYVNSPIIEIKCVNGSVSKSLKSAPRIEDIPLYFVDDFNKWKEEWVGTMINYLGDSCQVVDLVWEITKGKGDVYYWPYVVYRSIETGEEYKQLLYSALKEWNQGWYETELSSVEKPVDEAIRYGETKVVNDEGKTKYSYIDNVIDILIFGDSQKFSFVLKNISDNSIKLVWNEAVFVSINGSTSRVMHNGIKYSERNGDQLSSLIIKGAKLVDVIIPNDNVRPFDGSEWNVESMYPKEQGWNGQVSLMLPIQIKDTINEYIFVFDVNYKWAHPELHSAD